MTAAQQAWFLANRDRLREQRRVRYLAVGAPPRTDEQRAKERAAYAKNKEHRCAKRRARNDHLRAARRVYVQQNKDKVASYYTAYRFRTTREQISALRAAHPVCAICGGTNNGRPLVIDHDHTTNQIRALLCSTCNWGLGHFRDNPALLSKAAMYLAHYRALGAGASG